MCIWAAHAAGHCLRMLLTLHSLIKSRLTPIVFPSTIELYVVL